jgi:hypothetical protein
MRISTATLFGTPEHWADLRIELDSVHTLWGGQIIRLTGAGNCSIRKIAQGKTFEQRYSLTINAAETHAIIATLIRLDICAITPDQSSPIAPDTVANQITISRGEYRHNLLIWGAQPSDPVLREILSSLVKLNTLTSGMTAVYVGPYREA